MNIKLVSLALYGISAVAAQHVRANLKHPTISTYHLRGENLFPHFKEDVTNLRALSRILGKDKDRKKVDEAYQNVEDKISDLDKKKDELDEAVTRGETLKEKEDKIKEEIENTSAFDEDPDSFVNDEDNKETVKAWFETGKEYKAAKVAHDTGPDVEAERDALGNTMTDVTNALDDSKGVKVKSDKGTLKVTKAHEKALKAIEKLEKESLKTAKDDLSGAEGERDTKEQALTGADTALETKLTEGGISQDDLENDLAELKGLKENLDLEEKKLNDWKAQMRFFYGKKAKAEDDGETDKADAAQSKIDLLLGQKTALEDDKRLKQEEYDQFFSDRTIDEAKQNEITGKLDELNAAQDAWEYADEKVTNALKVKDAFELAKAAAHDAKSEVGDIKSEIEDDLEDDKDDDDDDEKEVVVVVKDFENVVDTGSTVDEDIDRAAACVEPIPCSEAVENFMTQFLGNGRRLLGSVDYQDYCNEPDIVKAWGAGNNFFEAFLGDDDLYCIIAEAGQTLIHTTASRTRYLRGLTGLIADGLGDQLLAKEKDCGYSEEEIECMDQWRCNIEEMCAKEILNGEDDCFGIFDYVTACYIWCVGIL